MLGETGHNTLCRANNSWGGKGEEMKKGKPADRYGVKTEQQEERGKDAIWKSFKPGGISEMWRTRLKEFPDRRKGACIKRLKEMKRACVG